MKRRSHRKSPEPPAILDMTKVLAAAARDTGVIPTIRPGPDMRRVAAAAARLGSSPVRPAHAVHMALPPEDAGRRRPLRGLTQFFH